MKFTVKRVDKSVPLPVLHSKESIKLDFVCRRDVIIGSREAHSVPANVMPKIPKGYVLILTLSPGLQKKGLVLSQGAISLDYADNAKEELELSVYNFGEERAIVLRGEVMAQGVFVKAEKASVQEEK